MSPTLLGLAFPLGTALIVIAGDVALKLAADGAHPAPGRMVLAGVVLYGLSALMWYLAMRQTSLAMAAVAYSMFTLIALCVIGAAAFDEPIGPREAMGIACAILAMGLMSHVG